MIVKFGPWFYVIIAGVIFAETAFVIFPFLPGDSLLFAIGLIAADEKRGISILGVFLLLTGAAILGNIVNYWVGKFFGERLFNKPNSKLFNQKNLKKTHDFFENYGGKAIIITRFVPIIRAFAPFVAGMGAMEFPKFMIFNVIGGVLWVGVCMFAGVFLGEIPIVRERFELAILGLVVISVAPLIFEFVMHRKRAKAQSASTSE
jgi:membrane-associated protein